MKLKTYPKYKDSGIEWIGEIPEGWDPIRLKYLLNRIDPGCWGSDFDEKGTIILRSTEIKIDGSWQIDNPATRSITEKERSNCLLKEGDLLVTKSSGSEKHIGKTALVNKDIEKLNCCFSNFMTRLRPNRKQKSKILHYFLNSDNARSQFNYFSNSTVGLGNLNEDCFKNLIFVKIPLDEQVKIQNFLDKKTAKIDALIEKDKKLIELLKEKRTALINHVVTKGLNPEAKMKDSGIEWIGEVPEGWSKNKIKHFSKMITGTTPDSGNEKFWDGDIIWVTPADLSQRKKYVSDSKRKITKEGYDSCGTEFVNKNGIILATRAPIGYATIVKTKLCFNQGCKAFEILKEFYPDYIYYFLTAFEEVIISKGNATTFGELSMYDLSSFEILKPRFEEQTQIVQYLDKATLKIDQTIQKIGEKIELLEEYKKSLIHYVVTGKVDVREVVA